MVLSSRRISIHSFPLLMLISILLFFLLPFPPLIVMMIWVLLLFFCCLSWRKRLFLELLFVYLSIWFIQFHLLSDYRRLLSFPSSCLICKSFSLWIFVCICLISFCLILASVLSSFCCVLNGVSTHLIFFLPLCISITSREETHEKWDEGEEISYHPPSDEDVGGVLCVWTRRTSSSFHLSSPYFVCSPLQFTRCDSFSSHHLSWSDAP